MPMAWPTPHIQSNLMDFAGSLFFASIHFCKGYWQLPLVADSQGYHSFLTPKGVFQPRRTLKGALNAAQNFQSKVEPCCGSIKEALKAWLDDLVLHAHTNETLIEVLRAFLGICGVRKLERSAKKTVLFSQSIK